MSDDEMSGWHHRGMNMNLCKPRETVRDREAWQLPSCNRQELLLSASQVEETEAQRNVISAPGIRKCLSDDQSVNIIHSVSSDYILCYVDV